MFPLPLSLGYKGYTHTAPLVITATHIGLTGIQGTTIFITATHIGLTGIQGTTIVITATHIEGSEVSRDYMSHHSYTHRDHRYTVTTIVITATHIGLTGIQGLL